MKPKLFILWFSLFSQLVHAQKLSKAECQQAFAKLFGYVRYFHPSDEAANMDWNRFAVYGCSQVDKCDTRENLLSTLQRIFNPIAPTVKIFLTSDGIRFDEHSVDPAKPDQYKVTYWQHKGVSSGMKFQGEIYVSCRVNSKNSYEKFVTDENDFGNLMSSIPGVNYRGKKIKYSAAVKISEGTTGTGHLWFRVDKTSKKVGFFNNMDENPIRNQKWKAYEITGVVDSDATHLVFGCFLSGMGELLVDNVHLYYLENSDWKEIPIPNNNFEKDDISGSNNKTSWARRGKGYEIELSKKDAFEGRHCVSIRSMSKEESFTGKKLFDKAPAIGEVIKKPIGCGLSCIVPLALFTNENGTFPEPSKSEITDSINKTDLNDTSIYVRLADIIITWNVFRHFYPYFDVVKTDWENELKEALTVTYNANSSEFLIVLQQLTAKLKDGHVRIITADDNNYIPGIMWEFVEDKLVITGVCDSSLKFKRGDIVTQINGEEPIVYFEKTKSRISAATQGRLDFRASRISLMGEKGTVISIVCGNTKQDLVRNRRYSGKPGENCDDTPKISDMSFSFIDKEIAYVNLTRIEMKTIDSLMPELVKMKAIIFDLRGYPKNNDELISHLMTKNDTDNSWMQVPEIIYPDYENVTGFEKMGWNLRPKKPHLGGKIIFLTDGSAISYAESYMSFIEGYKLGIIVGQPTAGTNGNINRFVLPGNYEIIWTGMKVIKHDGSALHGVGVLPDLYVTKTIEGIRSGKDEFLDKAIEIAKE